MFSKAKRGKVCREASVTQCEQLRVIERKHAELRSKNTKSQGFQQCKHKCGITEEYLWPRQGSSQTVCLCSPSTDGDARGGKNVSDSWCCALSFALKVGVEEGWDHSGGTVTIHFKLMQDAMLEFLCKIKFMKKKKEARLVAARILELKSQSVLTTNLSSI